MILNMNSISTSLMNIQKSRNISKNYNMWQRAEYWDTMQGVRYFH